MAKKGPDVNPLERPVSLGRARQGSLPQKPRHVNLSKGKSKVPATDLNEMGRSREGLIGHSNATNTRVLRSSTDSGRRTGSTGDRLSDSLSG